ncbi:MAG TPA: hypothetical protein VFT12_00925 [Thermoanaerobaculia bacterium]|nr:hypothetical protein [Thermoanaerobaculia bacterium]
MYYKIDRTYLTDGEGKYDRHHDATPYLVPGDSASASAIAFVSHEHAELLGVITPLPGDKATAMAQIGHRVYVIFIERAAEAIRPRSV